MAVVSEPVVVKQNEFGDRDAVNFPDRVFDQGSLTVIVVVSSAGTGTEDIIELLSIFAFSIDRIRLFWFWLWRTVNVVVEKVIEVLGRDALA